MSHSIFNGRSRRLLPRVRVAVAALAFLPLAACDLDELLEVEDEINVTTETASDTANLFNAYAGAKSRFQTGLGGLQNRWGGIIIYGGMMADEIWSTDTSEGRRAVDRRRLDPSNSGGNNAFVYLQRARAEALNAAEGYATSAKRGSEEHAELWAIIGYSLVMLGEHYCSGIPLSRIPAEGPIVFGDPLSTNEIFARANEAFDSVIALSSNDYWKHVARVGKARSLLNQNQPAAAAAEAAQVPNTFAGYEVEFSEAVTQTYNAVFQMVNEEKRYSAATSEGVNGLDFMTDRTPITADGNGIDGVTPHYSQEMYPDYASSVMIATAVEARLIEAEAALRANNAASFANLLNTARALQGLTPLSDANIGGTADARVNTLFQERAYAMWLTAHRLGDLRRLVRQYNRNQSQVYPVGTTMQGEAYGTDVSLPVPFDEKNNPNYTTCNTQEA